MSNPKNPPQEMSDHDPNFHGRIQVLEKATGDLATNLSAFISSQKEENTRFYDALGEMSDKFTIAIEGVKNVVTSRGQITGQFVLLLIATGLSLIAIIGGAVHFYVSSQLTGPNTEIAQLRQQSGQFHSDAIRNYETNAGKIAALTAQLDEERLRAIKLDAEASVRIQIQQETVARMEKERREDMQEEIRRLRAKQP